MSREASKPQNVLYCQVCRRYEARFYDIWGRYLCGWCVR